MESRSLVEGVHRRRLRTLNSARSSAIAYAKAHRDKARARLLENGFSRNSSVGAGRFELPTSSPPD